jgi:hypothetical protein
MLRYLLLLHYVVTNVINATYMKQLSQLDERARTSIAKVLSLTYYILDSALILKRL